MIHTMKEHTPNGVVIRAEWNDENLRPSTLRRLRHEFDRLKVRGLNAVNVQARILMDTFSPHVDILMLPDFSGGGMQTFQEVLANQQAAGTLFNTYTTAKTVIPATNLVTLPSNWLTIGRMLRLTVAGAISNIVTTPGTMHFQVKIGSVAAFDTGNIQLNATAHTTLPFWLEIFLTCRSVGVTSAATFMGLAKAVGIMFTLTAGQTDSAQGMQSILAPATAPVVGTGFDSTIANIIDFWVGFSISNAGNGVRIDQYALTAMN